MTLFFDIFQYQKRKEEMSLHRAKLPEADNKKHTGLTLNVDTVRRLDAIRGEFSRSIVVEAMILECLDALELPDEHESTKE
jgi:hypothetical protein